MLLFNFEIPQGRSRAETVWSPPPSSEIGPMPRGLGLGNYPVQIDNFLNNCQELFWGTSDTLWYKAPEAENDEM